ELQPLIFGLFLSMYLVTVLGNLLIILATISHSHPHTPMYFFLSNLSFVDICFTSTTVPKMLVNIQTQSKALPTQAATPRCAFFIFVELDNFLLAVMAYDRYVAICHRCTTLLCGLLVLVCWILSVLHALLQSLMTEIPHFFCELNQVVQLACSDTFLNGLVRYLITVLLEGGPLAGIMYSYSKILSSIRAISSAEGRYKAFSTCASHLSMVSLFHGTSFGVYLSFAAAQSLPSSATASVMYTGIMHMVTPMLNPFIYSLKNKDIKGALLRLSGGKL
ncbi:OR7A17-containing, partial [Ictidomys tridecemlineatus]|uniref:Olfactory receptor n=1 Tax=Ictidomys tridecemlineatus TaxID=43179 RepID=A0A287D6B0_ICTTR